MIMPDQPEATIPGDTPEDERSDFVKAFIRASEGEPDEAEETDESEDDDSDEETSEEETEEDDGSEEDEAEGDSEGDESGAESAPAPDSSIEFKGRTFTSEQLEGALQVADWWSQQPPELMRAVDALYSGDYVLVPRDQQPAAEATPTVDPDEQVDPVAHARLTQLESELRETRAQEQARLQREAQEVQQRQLALVNKAQDTWRSSHSDLTDGEILALREDVANLGILPGLLASKGDLDVAMQSALDIAYMQNPKYREMEINKAMERDREQAVATTRRKRKASSLSGSGGSVSRTPPPANTKESRRDAMVAELRSYTSGGQQT